MEICILLGSLSKDLLLLPPPVPEPMDVIPCLTVNSVPSRYLNPLNQSITIPSMWRKACPSSPLLYPHEMCAWASSLQKGFRERSTSDPLSCLPKAIFCCRFQWLLFPKMLFAVD